MLRRVATTVVGRVLGGYRGSYSKLIAGHNSRWISAYSTEGGDDKDGDDKDGNDDDDDEGDDDDHDDEGGDKEDFEGDEGEDRELEAADGEEEEEVEYDEHGVGYELPERFTGDDYGLIDMDDSWVDWRKSDMLPPDSWLRGPRVKMTAVVPFFPLRDPEYDEEDENYDPSHEDDPEFTYERDDHMTLLAALQEQAKQEQAKLEQAKQREEEEGLEEGKDEEGSMGEKGSGVDREDYLALAEDLQQEELYRQHNAFYDALEELEEEEGELFEVDEEERAKIMEGVDWDSLVFTEEEKALLSEEERARLEAALSEDGEDLENVSEIEQFPIPLHVDDVMREGWLYDMTGKGETLDRNPSIMNGNISDYSKTLMFIMHTRDPKTFDVATLATNFKMRHQRVMAILAMKKTQYEAEQHGTQPLFPELTAAFEEIHGSVDVGYDDRHIKDLNKLPMYKAIPEGTSPQRVKELLPVYISPEEQSRREEKVLVARFKANLEYNLGIIAPGLNRKGRLKNPGRRPEGGWGLMVIPLAAKNSVRVNRRAKREGWSNKPEKPYVAYPDGTKRDINEDEKQMFKRRTPRKARRPHF